MTHERPDLFGRVRMGYAVIESNKLDEWRRFLKQGIGLHLESETDDQLAFRIDHHVRRLIINRGPSEDFVALGWQIDGEDALEEIRQRLTAREIAIEPATSDEAHARGVVSFERIVGPKGLPLELFVQPLTTDEPLRMLSSGFVTDEAGMGHVAITTRHPEKMQRFWQEIFDARLSDRISQKLAGVVLDVTFLRLNERHHSVAIAATRGFRLDPIRTQVQHFNLLCNTREDLAEAYARLRDLGYEMAHEIGQHPNDLEISFYVLTPSGFEMEFGWDAIKVDEATWKSAHYNAISSWGHKPQKATLVDNLLLNAGNFQRGLRSLLKPEYTPL